MGLKLTMLLFWFSDEYSRIWIVYDLLGFFLSFSFWSHYSSCLPSLPWFIVWMIEVMIILIDFSLKAYLNFRTFFLNFSYVYFFSKFWNRFLNFSRGALTNPHEGNLIIWATLSFGILGISWKTPKSSRTKKFFGASFFLPELDTNLHPKLTLKANKHFET